MMTAEQTVFRLWCRLTGNDEADFGPDEQEAFLARPQVHELARTPYPLLLDAGIIAGAPTLAAAGALARRGAHRAVRSAPSCSREPGRRRSGRRLRWPPIRWPPIRWPPGS